MHGTGVLCVISAHWVVSDTHTSRAMLIEKLFLFMYVKIRMLQR
jgi:hypothetical protein